MAAKIGFVSLGCAKNQVNTEQMIYLLQQAGYEILPDPDGADVAVVNTCGFIDSAKSEAIDNILALGELKKAGRLGKILVAGCLSQRYQEEILRDKGIEEFLDIEGRVCEALDAEQTVVATGGSVVYREGAMRHLQELGTVVYLRVALDDLAARLNDMKGRGVALREGQTLADLYRERTVLYEKYAELTVSEDGQTMEDTVAAVKEALSRR